MSDSTYRTIAVSLTGNNEKAMDSLDTVISKVQILRDTIAEITKNQKIRVTASVANEVKTRGGRTASEAQQADAATTSQNAQAAAMDKTKAKAREAAATWRTFANGAVNALKRSSSAARSFLGTLKDLTANGIGKLVERFTDGYKKINQFLSSIGRVALYRAIRSAIKEVTQAINEGIQNLYRWSRLNDGEFSTSMDRLATEALHVKNALGAMLAPVINALVPIVEKLAHAFIDVVNGINQFLSAVMGASTWTKALHTPITYAQAMGSGFDKATKKAKELKNTILGFDEINRLNDNTNNSNNTEGGVPELPYGSMFKKEGLSDFWKDWLKKIDWTDLGKLAAQKANAALRAIDNWILNTARPWAMKWSTRIATFLNGFVQGFNWRFLGKTIADGMMTIVYAVNNFFRIFDAKDFGRDLAKTVDGWFKTIDWPAIGVYFTNKLNFLIDTASGFFETFAENAFTYGANIAEAFKSWVDGIHWEELRSGLTNGLESIANLIKGFVTNEDGSWDKLKTEFISTIKTVLSSPSLDDIINAGTGLINSIIEAIPSMPWEQIGEKIGIALGGINWGAFLANTADAFLRGLGGAIKGWLESDHAFGNTVAIAIVAALGGVFGVGGGILSGALNQIGKNIVLSIGEGMASSGAASALASQATVMGMAIPGGLALPLAMAVAGVGAAAYQIKTHWQDLTTATQVFADEGAAYQRQFAAEVQLQAALAAKGIEVSTEDIRRHLNGTISLAELTGGAFGSMTKSVGDDMSNISKVTSDALGKVSDTTVDFTGEVNGAVSAFLTKASDGSTESMKTLSDDTVKIFKDISDSVGKINQALSNSFSRMASSISESMQRMYNSVSSNMTRIASNVEQNARRIQNAFNSVTGSASRMSVPQYATGGFPEDGLFMANHGELVGQFSNGKTAVANNAEIIEGIEQGVFNAMSAAISTLGNGSDGGDLVIMIDSEEIARASMKGQRKVDRRMNPTVKFTG